MAIAGRGDKLAQGAYSANFGNSSVAVTQDEWDKRVGKVPARKRGAKRTKRA